MKKGLLIVLSGPAGVGKGTVCSTLMEQTNDIALSVSHTTRDPRPGEIPGVTYHYITEEQFKKNIDNDCYFEWAEVHNHFYGTPKDFVANNIAMGIDTLLEIDTQGALLVKKAFPEGVFIFVLPPDKETLEKRLRGRNTEDEETIQLRLHNAVGEFKKLPEYDYAIVNDDVQTAVDEVLNILTVERLKTVRGAGLEILEEGGLM